MVKSKKNIKKAFYDVALPMTSMKVSLYAGMKEELVGKTVKIDLTRSLKGKSLEIKYRLEMVNDDLIGRAISAELAGSYVRRMMRKGVDYVEDSFVLNCKDGEIVVKPFLISRNRISRSIRNNLRMEARKLIESHFKTRTVKELFSEIISNKIQREISLKLKKIYPLALCEIRVFRIVENKNSSEAPEANAAAAAA